MSADLSGHDVLVRRRRYKWAATGWVARVEDVLDAKTAQPAATVDTSWPADWGARPTSCKAGVTAWWDNGWPRAASPDRVPVVWLQTELGTRAAAALIRPPSYRTPDCQWCEDDVRCPGRCPWVVAEIERYRELCRRLTVVRTGRVSHKRPVAYFACPWCGWTRGEAAHAPDCPWPEVLQEAQQ